MSRPKNCACVSRATIENDSVMVTVVLCPLHEAAPELLAALLAVMGNQSVTDQMFLEDSETLEKIVGLLQRLTEQMGKQAQA